MRTSYAMMALRVTPPAKDEVAEVEGEKEVEVEGVEEVRGIAFSIHGHLGRSWASLYQTIAASMAHIMEKCVDSG